MIILVVYSIINGFAIEGKLLYHISLRFTVFYKDYNNTFELGTKFVLVASSNRKIKY